MSKLGGLDEELIQDVEEEKVTEIAVERPKRRPFHYWKVGDREYKLKLTTSMIEKLENKYRTNIINLVGRDDLPPLTVMITIVQAAMSPWEHNMSYSDVKKVYDAWFERGGNQVDFFTEVVMPTLAVSGFFTDKQAASMMENLKEMDGLL
jgi:hypothetical protein|nr:MAG TPA: tail assembly chaperone protein [Caudoviricetes sp.]